MSISSSILFHLLLFYWVNSIITQESSCINILKAPTGINKYNYLQIPNIPIFNAASIRFLPQHLILMIQKFQTHRNTALSVATGCFNMTPIDHLREETKVLPVHNNLSLLCSQYFVRTIQSRNPSQNVVSSPSGFRSMKYTLQSRILHRAVTYLQNDIHPAPSSKTAIKFLHNVTVSQLTYFLIPNRVLSDFFSVKINIRSKPPSPYRTSLSQTCLSFCTSLLSHRERIGLIISKSLITKHS